jgi:hypothetical protein
MGCYNSNADLVAPCSMLTSTSDDSCDDSHRQCGTKILYISQEALEVDTVNCARTPQTAAMNRKLVWIEQRQFRGFGCSECGWRFQPSGAPTGTSFDEMMSNFELQRDKEFVTHLCADHPRNTSAQ